MGAHNENVKNPFSMKPAFTVNQKSSFKDASNLNSQFSLAFAVETARRKSDLSLGSPLNGRPQASELKKMSPLKLEEPSEAAFSVPDTPPNLQTRTKGEEFRDEVMVGKETKPFPEAEYLDTRHVVCTNSLQPWTYLLEIPGKNVRDVLIDSFNKWLEVPSEQLNTIKQVVGYLHSSSLIIDDIEDDSLTRRGQPASHVVFGIPRALNAGNYVYFLALEKLLTLQSTSCVEIYTSELLNLHRGQGRDIYWRSVSYVASEEEYVAMVVDKTGGLFRLAIRIMQAMSPHFNKITPSPIRALTRTSSALQLTMASEFAVLSDDLACYFQVRDDLINLASPLFHQKKGFCEDITEGKLSFVALHSLRTYQSRSQPAKAQELLSILKSGTTDPLEIRKALSLMDDTDSFAYTLQYLHKLTTTIRFNIAKLGENPVLLGLLSQLDKDLDDCRNVKSVIEG